MTYKRYILSLDFILEEDGKKIKADRLGAATLVVPVLQRADGTLMEAKVRTEDFNHMADMVRQFIEADNDAAPVIHAHWSTKKTIIHDGELYCSRCEHETERRTTYCPNCGAKMDEE